MYGMQPASDLNRYLVAEEVVEPDEQAHGRHRHHGEPRAARALVPHEHEEIGIAEEARREEEQEPLVAGDEGPRRCPAQARQTGERRQDSSPGQRQQKSRQA